MSSNVTSSHPDLKSFLDGSPVGLAIRQAMSSGQVAIVPAAEGSNRVEAHADMRAYLKGRTLSEAVAATIATPAPEAAQPERVAPGGLHPHRRRPS